jgi:NitT/TauT family transport system substrate-binding protein
MAHLRMNQGVAAIFYLPHVVAQEIGAFGVEGLTVEFMTSFYGRQWGLLERGEADLTIGGPMRTMRRQSEEGKRAVNFCAAVRANPWFLVGRRPEPGFTFANLVGRTVIDFADAETPGLCFRWLLQQHGIGEDQVTLLRGLGTAREVEAFRAGHGDYLMHALHTAAPLVAAGHGHLVQDLATPTGPIPWSAYAALPETIAARRAELEAFTRAIGRALRWIAGRPAAEIAARVIRHFPSFTPPVLADTIGRYQALGIWPRDPLLPRADYERFRAILLATGWISRPVPYEDQVDPTFAEQAIAALGLA